MLSRAINACTRTAKLALLLAAFCTLLSFTSGEHWRHILVLIAAPNPGLSLFPLLTALTLRKQHPEDHDR